MTGEGFPPSARLKRSVEFKRIQKTGRRLHTKSLVVCFASGSTQGVRFGLTVSRRVGNAVTRNQVKRWLREGIRRSNYDLSAADVVFIAKSNAASRTQPLIAREVQDALRRIARA